LIENTVVKITAIKIIVKKNFFIYRAFTYVKAEQKYAPL